MNYKNCAVPMCKSTSISTPKKLFIYVPKSAQIRKKWLKLAGRDPASLTSTSTCYFCEDHFDLQNDMENYTEYTIMGVVSRIRMRSGCLPTRFACQKFTCQIAKVSTSADVDRPATAKRQRLALMKECEVEIKSENLIIEEGLDQDPSHEQQQEIAKIDRVAPILNTAKHRSKAAQTPCMEKTSALKRSSKSASTYPFEIEELKPLIKSEPFSSSEICTSNNNDDIFEIEELKPLIKPEPFSSSETCTLSNDDISDSDISLNTPSVVLISKTSVDTNSLDKPELKNEANLKCMVEHTVDKIEKRPQFYIGVPRSCYDIIKTIHKVAGIPERQILLCLKKIRLDSKFCELSDEFEISTAYARKIFTENIPKIAKVMRPFIVNLDKSSIKRCLPIAFRKKYYDVNCIIDCLEIEIQKPGEALSQSLTWSENKKANTIKYLISSTPNGMINYISQGYGGRISDVSLVENCDFLKCLPSESHVMADRGVKDIEPLLLGVGCKLTRLPSNVSVNKLSNEEVKEIKEIASLQIMDRVIRRVKEFSFLKPHVCINNDLVENLNDIVVIACGLVNLQNSLIHK